MRMTDATLPALSSPASDAVISLPVMDCTAEEEALQSASNMTDSSQSSGSGPAVPFCDITDPSLLKHCSSDMLESPECLNLKEMPYSNDIGGPATPVQNVAFSLSNQKILEKVPYLKTSPSSQGNLCSIKAFSAKKSAGETTEPQLDVCSTAEANHLQLPVLPKLDASSSSSTMDVDLLDKLMAPTDQLPVSVETKEDPLSIDSSTSIKSSNSLSCDETSSKDSLLTSTESKSVGSPPEADLTHSTEAKDLFEASKSENAESEGLKGRVSSLPEGDCVKPFVIVPDETDSGCPSDSDGLAMLNVSEEPGVEKVTTQVKVITDAPSNPLAAGHVADINFSAAPNAAMSSNSLNLNTSVSTNDGSHGCDPAEKIMDARTSSSSVAITGILRNVGQVTKMPGKGPSKGEINQISSQGIVGASLALDSIDDNFSGNSTADILSFTEEKLESSKEKSLMEEGNEKLSGIEAQSPLSCNTSRASVESLPQSSSEGSKLGSDCLGDAVKIAHGKSIRKECKVVLDRRDGEISYAMKKGILSKNLESARASAVAPPINTEIVGENVLNTSSISPKEFDNSSIEKCTSSTTETLFNVCKETTTTCENPKSPSAMEVDQLLGAADEIDSKDVKNVAGPDATTETSESWDTSSTNNQAADSIKMDCIDTCTLLTTASEQEGSEKSSSSHSSSTTPDEDAVEPKCESFIALETKDLVSAEATPDAVTESESNAETLSRSAGASGSGFSNELQKAELPDGIQSNVVKSSDSLCLAERIADSSETASINKESVPSLMLGGSSVVEKTSVVSQGTAGQVLKVEHPESLEEECFPNITLDAKASESSTKGLLPSTSGDMDVDKKVEISGNEATVSSKPSASGNKIFPSIDGCCDAGNVVLQTVVGGVLQTLDVAALEARKREEEDSDHRKLFAGVDDELTGVDGALSRNTAMHVLENNAGETDGIGGLVINSVVGAFGEGADEYADGESAPEADSSNKELADISSSYHGMAKDIDAQQTECEDMPRSKRPRLESVEPEARRPVVLRVKPVKGKSDSFWDSPKLRAMLAEKGTVLLRLCSAEPTEEFDTPADFVGVMLECCEDSACSGLPADRQPGPEVYSVGADGGYHSGIYSHYGYLARTTVGGEEDFVETEEVEESLDYDGATHALDWQGKRVSPAYGARQSMPPPSHLSPGATYAGPVSPPFMRGKRKHGMRGRPPVHVRGVYHMVAPAPTPASSITAAPGATVHRTPTVAPSYPPHHYYSLPPPPYTPPATHTPVGTTPPSAATPSKSTKGSSSSGTAKSVDNKASPIIYRPPTPPQVTDTPKLAALAAGPLRRCSSLLSVRRPAPGSILSQQMKLLYKEDSSDASPHHSSAVRSKQASSKSSSPSKKSSPKKQKLPCDYCPSKFRKRTALLAHIKHKHRLMKKCPICNVGVRVKGKYNMKFHILKNHKEINNFACGDCGAVFKLQHHLKNHIRLGCEPPEIEEQSSTAAAATDMSLSDADILVPSTAEAPQDVQTNDRELELLGSEVSTNDSQAHLSERKSTGKGGFDDRPESTAAKVSEPNVISNSANASKRKRSRSRMSESSSDLEEKKKEKTLNSKLNAPAKPSRKRQKVDASKASAVEPNASEEAKDDSEKSQNNAKNHSESSTNILLPGADKCNQNNQVQSKSKFDMDSSTGHGDSDMDKAESSEGETNSSAAKPKAAKLLKKRGRKPKMKSTDHEESSDESDHEMNAASTEARGKTRPTHAKSNTSVKVQRDSSRERTSQCPKTSFNESDHQPKVKKSTTRLKNSTASGIGSGESDADIHKPNLRGSHSSKLPGNRPSRSSGSGSECDKSERKEAPPKSLRSKMSSPTRPSRRTRIEEEVVPVNIKAQTILKRLKIDNGRSSRSNSEAGGSSSDSEIEEEKRFFCKQCDAGFSHAFKLRHHRREVHSGSGGGTTASSVPSTPKDVSKLDLENSMKFTCGQCGKNSRNAYQLRLHTLTHTASENASKSIKKPLGRPPKDRTKTPPKVSDAQQHENPTEDKKDSQEESSAPETSDVPTTGASVRSNASLNQLPSYIIKKARIFICTKCSLTFKREKSVTYHMKKIHETLYPFKACPHCGRVFRSCGPYHKHMKLHNIRHCPVEGCKARYRAFRKMKQHQKSSHEDYPYRCTSCEQLYKHQHELDAHSKVAHIKHDPEEEDEDDASEGEQQVEEDTGEPNDQESSKQDEESASEEKPKLNIIDQLDIENLPNKRRTRTELSYKEEEEEDSLLVKNKRPLPMINKSPFKRKTGFARSPFKASSEVLARSKSKRINEVEKLKKTDFDIFKRSEELDRSSRRRTIEEPPAAVAQPKKVAKKKKITMSWTAALKARIKAEARAAAASKPLKVNRPKTPKSSSPVKSTKTSTSKSQKSPISGTKSPSGVKSPKSPPSVKAPKSPAVAAAEPVKVPQSPREIIANENLAALVVRRVAETLASQEVADLKVPCGTETYKPTTPSPASSAPPPPPTPPPTAPTPPSIPHQQHFGPYPAPYPFPPHYYGYPHPPPPMYHPHHPPYPPPHLHHPGYHPPYAGSEDSCSSVDTHQDNSSNSTDRPDSPNKVLRFDNF